MTPENNEETIIKEDDNEERRNKAKRKFDKYEKEIEKLNEEIEKLKADADHWKNEYYRAYADTKNLRANLEKDHSTALKYRAEGFIDELLPVLDSFYFALGNEPTDPTLKNYLIGFQYIYRNLVTVLENEGVTELYPKVGDKFDAATMNAVDTVETDGEENLVVKVLAKGYKLHDRLVRPTNVTVSVKAKKLEKNNETQDSIDA